MFYLFPIHSTYSLGLFILIVSPSTGVVIIHTHSLAYKYYNRTPISMKLYTRDKKKICTIWSYMYVHGYYFFISTICWQNTCWRMPPRLMNQFQSSVIAPYIPYKPTCNCILQRLFTYEMYQLNLCTWVVWFHFDPLVELYPFYENSCPDNYS